MISALAQALVVCIALVATGFVLLVATEDLVCDFARWWQTRQVYRAAIKRAQAYGGEPPTP